MVEHHVWDSKMTSLENENFLCMFTLGLQMGNTSIVRTIRASPIKAA